MEYPKELHDDHNDYPLAPESFKIEQDMLSPYQKELLTRLGMKEGYYTKLMPNLFDKEKYVLHYRNLQLYLSLGMKLPKSIAFCPLNKAHGLKPTLISIQP